MVVHRSSKFGHVSSFPSFDLHAAGNMWRISVACLSLPLVQQLHAVLCHTVLSSVVLCCPVLRRCKRGACTHSWVSKQFMTAGHTAQANVSQQHTHRVGLSSGSQSKLSSGVAEMVRQESDMEGMNKEAIWQMVQQLQAGLQAREKQLERQGQQLSSMQEVQHQLQVRPLPLPPHLSKQGGVENR